MNQYNARKRMRRRREDLNYGWEDEEVVTPAVDCCDEILAAIAALSMKLDTISTEVEDVSVELGFGLSPGETHWDAQTIFKNSGHEEDTTSHARISFRTYSNVNYGQRYRGLELGWDEPIGEAVETIEVNIRVRFKDASFGIIGSEVTADGSTHKVNSGAVVGNLQNLFFTKAEAIKSGGFFQMLPRTRFPDGDYGFWGTDFPRPDRTNRYGSSPSLTGVLSLHYPPLNEIAYTLIESEGKYSGSVVFDWQLDYTEHQDESARKMHVAYLG